MLTTTLHCDNCGRGIVTARTENNARHNAAKQHLFRTIKNLIICNICFEKHERGEIKEYQNVGR